MRVEFGTNRDEVECRECHARLSPELTKFKLFPVEGDDRWFYYFHGDCFARALTKVVGDVMTAIPWSRSPMA